MSFHYCCLACSYEMMQLCRQFENACNQAYMQGHIRGFMHLDNGQESIPAMIADTVRKGRPGTVAGVASGRRATPPLRPTACPLSIVPARPPAGRLMRLLGSGSHHGLVFFCM